MSRIVVLIAVITVCFVPWHSAFGDAERTNADALRELSVRLSLLERNLYRSIDQDQESWNVDRLNLKKLAGVLVATSAPKGVAVDASGTVDIWLPVRRDLVKAQDIVALYGSRRFRATPTIEQLSRGDFAWLPYGRFEGAAPSGETPILWDRWPTKRGRLVAFANGRVRLVEEKDFEGLMKRFSQSLD